MIHRLIFMTAMFLSAASSDAADVWLLRVQGYGTPLAPCSTVRMTDAIVFQNTTTTEARIRLLSVSNAHDVTPGVPPVLGTADLVIAPGRTTSVTNALGPVWQSNPPVSRWITHLSVPEGTIADSRLELGVTECASPSPQPPNDLPVLGRVELPVFRTLAPAGSVQRLLSTDSAATAADVYVGTFNASATAAIARLELRRACDDAIVATATLDIAPNTLREHRFEVTPAMACGSALAPWAHYTLVTVDEPSITYALSIPRTGAATVGIARPVVAGSTSPRRRSAAVKEPQ